MGGVYRRIAPDVYDAQEQAQKKIAICQKFSAWSYGEKSTRKLKLSQQIFWYAVYSLVAICPRIKQCLTVLIREWPDTDLNV